MKRLLCLISLVFFISAFDDGPSADKIKIAEAQISFFQGEQFIQKGITGRKIRIAILDGGFPGVNTHPALKQLIERNQIAATWNFVHNSEDVFTGVSHGTEVLACIAGNMNGHPLGLAPDAEFLLAVTEEHGEPRREEENWAKAVDWAIEHGANIIQSSLGYTYQRYFTTDLDGRHSIAARAAVHAARKGILVVNCNGNEGQSKWETLVTPADADSILSVGAIDPETGLVAGFSSVGPTADKRIKPNVCAPGIVVSVNPSGGFSIVEGTSFSSPLVTGFAACTWQVNPSLSAFEIMSLIERSGHLYPYYDYSHGYGVPQASRILHPDRTETNSPVDIQADENNLKVQVNATRSTGLPDKLSRYLYYHISSPDGFLKSYGVYLMNGTKPLEINKSGLESGDIFRCSYQGQTSTWQKTP